MKEPKAVIFDMDGVLIDARDWHYLALNEALSYFGLEIDRKEHEERFDGLPTKTKLRMLSDEKRLPEALHQIISEVKQDRTLRFAAAKCFPVTQHQLLLGRLEFENKKIAVATNSIRKTAEFMLEYAGVTKFLDVLVTNEDVKLPKPDPEIYLKAAHLLDVMPDECLVFEDNPHGVQAARAAGCQVLIVDSPDDVSLDTYFTFFSRNEAVT